VNYTENQVILRSTYRFCWLGDNRGHCMCMSVYVRSDKSGIWPRQRYVT